MTVSDAPLTLELFGLPADALPAQEWLPATLVITRPASRSGSVQLRGVFVNEGSEPDLQLEAELFQHGVDLAPGETYRLAIRLRIARPKMSVNLAAVYVDYQQAGTYKGQIAELTSPSVPVRPSLRHELAVTLEPVCPYGDGVKVQCLIHHTGATSFQNLAVSLTPDSSVLVGKHLRRDEFRPGESFRLEAVVTSGELTILVTAAHDGQPLEVRHTHSVERTADRHSRPLFRFLEPRQMSVDHIEVHAPNRNGSPLISPTYACYALPTGEPFDLIVRPQQPNVQSVALRGVPGAVAVLSASADADKYQWTFRVQMSSDSFLSKHEQAYYDMEVPGRTLTGELSVRIDPPPTKYLAVAAAFGAIVTIQGAVGVFNLVAAANGPRDALAEFGRWENVLTILSLLAVPGLAAGLYLLNAAWCRLTR